MVRISKQSERRARFPRRTRKPMEKTGSKKDKLTGGYKKHENALSGDLAATAFIPKIK